MKNNLNENLAKLKDYKFAPFGQVKNNSTPIVRYEDLNKLIESTIAKPPCQKINTKTNIKKTNDTPPVINYTPITNNPSIYTETNRTENNQSSKKTTEKPIKTETKFSDSFPINQVSLKDPPFHSNQKPPSLKPPENPSYKSGFTWDKEVRLANANVFRNKGFRENQVEIINAVLSQKDVFVIMPTGGGKSLTFQLPALLSPGISVIIMPLISLIFDQLKRLNELNIGARDLNSSQTAEEQAKVFDDIICSPEIKVLFATPEKLSQSHKLNWFLQKLEERNRLSRFVIDEAHCVSQWGRDFRKDYMKLSKFRENFPAVPILALTGTATEKVTEDVIKNLGMKDCQVFKSSFNRPNLFYEVRPKEKNAIDQIHKIIVERFSNDSGLIYCSTKKDCEKVVKRLKSLGISADFFHSEVNYDEKLRLQGRWMTGQIKVLVATVAFGMGIDKQEVRFVFHYSIPKSLENYYQESGRAGRDGKESLCTIFYKYSDKSKLDYLIGKSTEVVQQEINFQELQSIIAYCEDVYTCRREQQLAYFNEKFSSANCNKTCDNCLKGLMYYERDVTDLVKKVIELYKKNSENINTLIQIIAFVKGKKSGRKDLSWCEGYGLFKNEENKVLEQMMKKMVHLEIFKEKSVKLFRDNSMTKIELGKTHQKILKDQMRVVVKVEIAVKKTKDYDFDKIFPDSCYDQSYFDNIYGNWEFPENEDQKDMLDIIGSCEVNENSYFDVRENNTQSGFTLNPTERKIENEQKDLDLYPEENDYPDLCFAYQENKDIPNSLQDIPKLSLGNLENYGKAQHKENFTEIHSRLSVVREIVALKHRKKEEDVISNNDLVSLCRDLPTSGPLAPEFYREISLFKQISGLREYDFKLDLESVEIVSQLSSLKRSYSPPDSNEKMFIKSIK